MRGLNRIVIIGRLGADPELRQGKTGTAWCSFSVATNRHRKEGEAWVEETDWHDIRAFGEDAERCHKRLRRGSIVAVDGSLVYETWNDEQGQRRRRPRILASRLQFVSDLKQAPGEPAPEADPTLDVTAI
jgi:single-strand DNA-binding protein